MHASLYKFKLAIAEVAACWKRALRRPLLHGQHPRRRQCTRRETAAIDWNARRRVVAMLTRLMGRLSTTLRCEGRDAGWGGSGSIATSTGSGNHRQWRGSVRPGKGRPLGLGPTVPLLPQMRYIKTEAADFESYKDCARVDDLVAFLIATGLPRWDALSSPLARRGDAILMSCFDALNHHSPPRRRRLPHPRSSCAHTGCGNLPSIGVGKRVRNCWPPGYRDYSSPAPPR